MFPKMDCFPICLGGTFKGGRGGDNEILDALPLNSNSVLLTGQTRIAAAFAPLCCELEVFVSICGVIDFWNHANIFFIFHCYVSFE